MPHFHDNALIGASGGGGVYQISRSLRFNSADSANLSRAIVSAGNRKTWTWSGWVKRSAFGALEILFSSGADASNNLRVGFDANNKFFASNEAAGVTTTLRLTTAVYRDPGAWMHIVLAVDTTLATAADRVKLYVNGTEVTAFDTNNAPTQNTDLNCNNAGTFYIGRNFASNYLNAYLSEIHFISGSALAPSSFGEADATTGEWIPKSFSGSYGTNGHKLTFSDNSAATAAALGADTSGGGNNFTPINFAVATNSSKVTLPSSNAPTSIEYLVVGGGGGGGRAGLTPGAGGGGGAGGVLTGTLSTTAGASYNVVVGAGGVQGGAGAVGGSGGNSVFSTIAALGGGGGGGNGSQAPLSGGSGGGAGGNGATNGIGASGTAGQGFAGGSAALVGGSQNRGGGGGGASAVGVGGGTTGAGGAGITGFDGITYGGGGGGAASGTNSAGAGGTGGGGRGADNTVGGAVAGTANRGGGGGGGTVSFGAAAGGTGIVVLRYADTFGDLTVGSGLIFTRVVSGGFKTYTITASANTDADCDSLVDTPSSYGTDTGVGGEVRGNYCTLTPLGPQGFPTAAPVNGNLEITGTSGIYMLGTIAITSGQWYWEISTSAAPSEVLAGIALVGGGSFYTTALTLAATVHGFRYNGGTGVLEYTSDGATWTTISTTGLTAGASIYPLAIATGGGTTKTISFNFGQRPFAYGSSGFKAICDTNLPAPTIVKPSTVMDVKLYTGNDSTQSITGLGFSPDFAWIKSRSNASSHQLFDVIRGVGKALQSNSTNAEATNDAFGYLSAFNSDGFTVAAGGSGADYVNKSTWTYAAWCWDAGSSTVTNTAGTIQSSVRANASAGFSIVTYTGTGANATVGHGLGVAPSLIIIKIRSSSNGWPVYHAAIGNTGYLRLEATDATATASAAWNNTSPSSTVFTVGTGALMNTTSATYVAYCFAPVAGYSAFGSYTGNGSADGPFVYTGFRPRWVMVKKTSALDNWVIWDAARDAYNTSGLTLFPNLSNAESDNRTNNGADFLSNGFKLKAGGGEPNASSATYVWAAFAEFPFQYARGR